MAAPKSKETEAAEAAADAELVELHRKLMQPRKAVAISAQAAIFLPNGGGTETKLSHEKQKGIKLLHVPGIGVFIEHKGQKSFTPDTNLKDVWYEDDKPKAKAG